MGRDVTQECPLWVTCGRRLGKNFLTSLQHWSGAVMCPACLCGREAAGHNALRGSGPNRKHAFKDALTHAGCPDPRIDLVCITSSVLANSFNFKRHRRCLSHLLESLWLTQPVYSTSIPRSRRRPQHQSRHRKGLLVFLSRYDAGARHALQSAGLRRTAIS